MEKTVFRFIAVPHRFTITDAGR
jgi:hypothetical protein